MSGGGCGEWHPSDYGWGRGRRPVTDVTWVDAQAYVAWLSEETGETYRLPSEAEWEYAARAGAPTSRYWGDDAAGQCRYANGWDREWSGTPRGRALNARFGLAPVSCSDGFPPSDGSAWSPEACAQRTLRGGTWGYSAEMLRLDTGVALDPGRRDNGLGLGVVRVIHAPT